MFGKRTQAAFAPFPLFEYETDIVSTAPCSLDQYLNAKAALGWRLHTCQRVGEGVYFVVLDRLRREGE